MKNQARSGTNFWGTMKMALVIGLAIVLCLPTDALAQTAGQPGAKAGDIRVVLAPGDVARQVGAQVVKTDAQKGMALLYQDLMETGVGGRMRAKLDDGSILAVGPQSQLRVVQHNAQSQQTDLQMQYGKVRSQVVKLTQPGGHFEVRTNTAVAGVIGTDFIVDAFSPAGTLVICIEGRVEVRNVDPNVPGSVILNPGELTIVGQGSVPEPPRPATNAEMQSALDGTAGAAPLAVADIGTGFVTAGQNFLLDGSDSFATGGIEAYRWSLTRQGGGPTVYSQALAAPKVQLDTTPWQPGNYNGTLEIVTPANATGQTSFGFVVLPASASNVSPDQLIQQLQQAYESLQPTEFMKLFDPDKYAGYSALQQSVESSFSNLSQVRVFVRRANGQIFEDDKQAIYQVDFEVQFSTKAKPGQLFVVREQATLRMQSGSPWTISDVPQGALGGAGLPGIPGVSDPTDVNDSVGDVPTPGDSVVFDGPPDGSPILVATGNSSDKSKIKNTSASDVIITFDPPPGLSLTGNGVPGRTFLIPAGGELDVVFTSAPGSPSGSVEVPTSLQVGGSTLPGPDITITVFALSLSFPGLGATAVNPVQVPLGFSATAPVTVSSTVAIGHTVALTAIGGQVSAAFNPNPAVIPQGNTSSNSTITLSASAGAAPGPGQVAIQGTTGNVSASGTLFINRVAPFNLSLVGPNTRSLLPSIGTQLNFNVAFLGPFTGPVQVVAPAAANGVSFSPVSQTVNTAGQVSFTVTGTTPILSAVPFNFTASAGGFSQQQQVLITVVQPIDFSLNVNSLSLQPGQSGQAVATIAFVSGIDQPVAVALVPGSVDSSRISVTGGGTLPTAAGSVSFTVNALANAPPGPATLTISATSGGTVRQANVSVTILGDFSITAAPTVNVPQGTSVQTQVSISPTQGFNAPVAMTYSSNNAGVSVSGPASLSPGVSGALTITAAANASGAAAISLQGVSGNLTRNASITVGISAFTLTTNATQPIPLAIGGTASLPVTVAPLQGFNGAVQLAAAGTNGITLDSVSPVTGGSGTRTFTISAPVGALPGPATVTVTGTSGGLSAILQVSVILTDGFTLTSDPAIFFLGNTTQLMVHVQRDPGFTGNVLIQAGALPAAIVGVSPASVVVPAGISFTIFDITVSSNPGFLNQQVAIPFTGRNGGNAQLPSGSATASASTLVAGGGTGGGTAGLASFNATGTLRAPFDALLVFRLCIDCIPQDNLIQVGESYFQDVSVGFAPEFGGSVTVDGIPSAGLALGSLPTSMTGSGIASVTFVGVSPGTYSGNIDVTAGTYVVRLATPVIVTPPPFSLEITPSSRPIQFNSFLPTTIQVQVVRQTPTFNQPVTITVPDGSEVQYDTSCAPPAGFVSYSGARGQPGVLTFTVNPPYSPVSFCMSAGQDTGIPRPGADFAVITSEAIGINLVQTLASFRVGVPKVVVSRVTTFNIPLGGSVQTQVAVNAMEGFNLPVQLFITGPFSYSNDGINIDPLPAEITSADCGHPTGKTVQPNTSVICTLTNSSTGGNPSALDLLAFVLYPVANFTTSEEAAFKVCARGPSVPLGCGAGVLDVDPPTFTTERLPGAGQDQGRQSLDVRNGDCAGLRFLTGTASFCGGSSDLELNPTITADGEILLQGMATNGGITDLGPQSSVGSIELPDSGYPMRAALETGHLYAVQSQGKYALVYVGRIRSELDPRLAIRGTRSLADSLSSGLDGASGDDLADALLDRARINVELQWVYAGSGARRLSYSFAAATADSFRPGRVMQERQPAAPPAQ